MGTGWHKQRALENRAFPPKKAKRKRQPKLAPRCSYPESQPGNCGMCGNTCSPAYAPWTCPSCKVAYPTTIEEVP